MCEKLFPLLLLCLICAFPAAGQNVIENESTASVSAGGVVVRLAVEADKAQSVPARIELVDTAGVVVSSISNPALPLARGRHIVEFKFAIEDEYRNDDADLAWYRLRYRIGSAHGVASLSQLIKDLFELRIIAPQRIPTGIDHRTRVRALNPFTGRPASGVVVEALLELGLADGDAEMLELKGSAITDADGFANIDISIPADVTFDGNGDLTVIGRRNGIVREADEDVDTDTDDLKFMMMSDKPIYQPGQTLNLRGILLKGSEGMTVMQGTEIDVRILDEDDTLLYREKVVTSEFGVTSLSWIIPDNVRLGDYNIEAGTPGRREVGMHRVKITRYDLPNFVVNAESDKPYYLPADGVAEIEVKADYLFGKPVPRGKVRVVEENSREWNWKEQKYDIDEGDVVEGNADNEGKLTARFDLTEAHSDLSDDRWEHFRDIRFAAYFTDPTTNRTEQRRFDVRVSKEPIHVYFIHEWEFSPEFNIEAYISTFYADGTPAECEVEIRARLDDSEGPYQRVTTIRTNSHGAGKLSIPRPNIGGPDDDLELIAVARDTQGRHGTTKDVEVLFSDDRAMRVYTNKSIYKPGEPVRVDILSTVKNSTVHIDIVRGRSVVDSHFAVLKDGRAKLEIPYSDAFRGQLKIAAYFEDGDDEDEVTAHARGVIFPARSGLEVAATFDKAVYKPNEEASVSIGVLDYLGQAVRSALGIVVVDQAVEERARTDSEFAGMFRGWSDWLGYGANFGSFNVKDLNELDLTKPLSDEMQLVAEVILFSPNYYPNIFRTDGYDEEARYVFSPVIKRQFEPVAEALKRAFEKQNYLHPTNGDELRDILGRAGIDFDSMSDPWGVPYTAQFSVDKKLNVVTVRSAGPDKTFGTSDDFDASKHTFEYFTPIGKAIDAAAENYHKKTGEFIRDRETLLAELGEPEILDRYGRPYQFIFEGERRLLVTRIRSLGPDGKVNENSWRGDDFDVWTSRIDLFADLVQRINKVQSELPKTPLTETMFREELRKAGIDLDNVRDGNGEPVYINESRSSRFWDRITFETVQNHGEENRTFHRIITPVTQEIVKFTIRGPGRDRRVGTYDDVTVMEIVHVIAEQARDDLKPVAETLPAGHVNGAGMITGTVTDQYGAVVPGAVVTATNDATQLVRAVTSDADGRFEFTALPSGAYTLTVEAVGFMRAVVLKIETRPGITTRINIPMDVGSVSETVSVMAEGDSINTTSSYIAGSRSESTILTLPLSARNALQLAALNPGTTAGPGPNSTPRLREYFPETLLWQPEVITDAGGRAQVKFRMADNITTWKMYAIASSRDGKVGIAETKATAFQAFFADLDPPKFLTRGDEIFLPVQVRNYTDTEQGVNVEMAGADWFSFLAEPKKALTVRSGATENAVFGFRAEVPIVDGKQRVTAIADTDSDAIEKPVTVRPDGREMVNTESRYFTGTTAFDVDFPTNALPGTRSAELKIYPNLMSHVVESVEGLLERPYGCGEQTISSTYPNLMILKFSGSGSESRIPAATEAMARKYLRSGYERLVGYQVADGGFSYWGGRDTPDLALTAYALRFLADAAEFTSVDPSVVANAERWLLSQQRADGSWVQKYNWESSVDGNRSRRTTTYIARTLAMLKKMRNEGAGGLDVSLDRALAFLKGGNAGIDDPYALALYGLTLADSGDIAGAHAVAERIAALAKTEGTGIYWNLESNTAFNGWGSAGRIETTALVAQLLMKLDRETVAGGLVSKAMLFLLKNKDRYGVWYSTQTTINVLDTFLAEMDGQGSNSPQNIDILINGAPAGSLEIGPDKLELITVPLSDRLAAGANRVELRSTGQSPLMASVTAIHYVGWNDVDAAGRTVNDSRALHLDYKCDKTTAPIMEEVTCTVAAERIGYRGYGMLLAEIGIPPGADVSRESLEAASENNWSFARYEVLPDRIVAYLWARPGGTNFSFKFRPRYGINAKTPASVVYDYYNPEAQAVNAPLSFKID